MDSASFVSTMHAASETAADRTDGLEVLSFPWGPEDIAPTIKPLGEAHRLSELCLTHTPIAVDFPSSGPCGPTLRH